MADGRSGTVPRPRRRSRRWTSFVGTAVRGRVVRGLEQEGRPLHRARIEHDADTLLVHVSDEDGRGWTTIAIDRATRTWAVAQRARQQDAAAAACGLLYADTPSIDEGT